MPGLLTNLVGEMLAGLKRRRKAKRGAEEVVQAARPVASCALGSYAIGASMTSSNSLATYNRGHRPPAYSIIPA